MRKKDWADNEAETLHDFLITGPDDQAIIDRVAALLRKAHVHGMDEGATLARRNAFKSAFRGGFGRSAVPE